MAPCGSGRASISNRAGSPYFPEFRQFHQGRQASTHSFIQHYYLQLLQVPRRLLKIYSVTRRSQYAFLKPRFSKNSFIDSFGGGTL